MNLTLNNETAVTGIVKAVRQRNRNASLFSTFINLYQIGRTIDPTKPVYAETLFTIEGKDYIVAVKTEDNGRTWSYCEKLGVGLKASNGIIHYFQKIGGRIMVGTVNNF